MGHKRKTAHIVVEVFPRYIAKRKRRRYRIIHNILLFVLRHIQKGIGKDFETQLGMMAHTWKAKEGGCL